MRITHEQGDVGNFPWLLNGLNRASPESRFESSPRRGGAVAELARSDEWPDHERAIIGLLSSARDPLHALIEAGYSLIIDIAVEPDDVPTGRPYASVILGSALLQAVTSAGAELEVTVYSGASSGDE